MPFGYRTIGLARQNPLPKRSARISPFLDFLGGGELKELVSDEDSTALQNWVIQTTRKADALREKPLHRNPARLGADRCAMRGAFKRNSSKMARKLPQNRGPRSASVGHGNRGTMLRCLLALLARLERAAGPAGPTAALPQISPVEPITVSFSPDPTALPWVEQPCITLCGDSTSADPAPSGPSLRKRSEPLSSGGILSKLGDPLLRKFPERSAPLYFAFEPSGSELVRSLKE